MDPKLRFSNRVADYLRYRPSYPAGLVPALAEVTGLTPSWTVADVGSGTGISSRPFLEHGNQVIAVEPNAEMRQAAEAELGAHSRFTSVDGAAEATGLPDASVDLVVAGQAFHWFDPRATRSECRRILRRPAWTALVWNVRSTDADDFARGYEALLERWGTDYERYRARRIDRRDLATFFGRTPEERSLANEQTLDLTGLRGRLESSSYVPAQGDSNHAPMMEELDRLFARHAEGGHVRIAYETQIFAAPLD